MAPCRAVRHPAIPGQMVLADYASLVTDRIFHRFLSCCHAVLIIPLHALGALCVPCYLVDVQYRHKAENLLLLILVDTC